MYAYYVLYIYMPTSHSYLYIHTHLHPIYRYIQHPVAIKALGGDRSDLPLPMYLTKKERKRIRKTARAEREQEKRDKMMMGKCRVHECMLHRI